MDYKLVTSNEMKLKEFNSFGLDLTIEKGLDLPEIDTPNALDVIIYKSKDAGKGTIVEDTTVSISGVSITDIKFKLDELNFHDGADITWSTYLAKNDGESISIYYGCSIGKVKIPDTLPGEAFAFDPYFVPNGETRTLYELSLVDLKSKYSARLFAAEHLMSDEAVGVVEIDKIVDWEGEYQK